MSQFNRRDFMSAMAVSSAVPLAATLAQDQKPDPYADGKLIEGEPPLPEAGSFTLVVLPDTQFYSEKYPATYKAQAEWIVANQKTRNISAVLHLGDITNRNTAAEWKNANAAMTVLDKAKVPYFFCPGNHDYGAGGGCQNRTTGLNSVFPAKRYEGLPTFGGTYDKEPGIMQNSFHKFEAGGREFLVLALEFGPRKDVVRWANEVLKNNAKREVIFITHSFIYFDDTRYDWKKFGAKQNWNPHAYPVAKATEDDVTDGEELWNMLLSKHENVILTLNGHVLGDGLGRFHSKTPGGRDVPQILVNYQMRPNGGDGWLRLLEFKKDAKTVEVYDYSPVLKKRNEGKENRFGFSTAAVGKA